MRFSNPAIIKGFDDAKLAVVETDKEEMSYHELMAMVKYRLERLTKEEVDEMAKSGKVTRQDAVRSIAKRAYELLKFAEENIPSDEEDFVKILMESLSFENWSSGLWARFQQIHPNKIQMTTPIPTQGVLDMPEDVLTEALDELTLQGVLEVLMKFN